MKVQKRTKQVVIEEGRPDLELPAGAIEDTIKIVKTATGYVAGCLAPDEMADNPMETDEGLGRFVHWKDHGQDELLEYCEARGFDPETREATGEGNPDAVEIDKYEHSGVAYSVRGEGMNCQWDTSTAWAMWLPNKCLLEELKELTGKARRNKCVEFARQACETINQWFIGDVYGVIVITFDKAGKEIDQDSCWNYFGHKYAEEELQSQIEFAVNQANGRKGKTK